VKRRFASLHTKLRRASGRGGKAKRQHPEDDLQIAFVALLEDILIPGVVFAHVPNQGKRLARYLKKLHRMGMRDGVSDLIFWHAGRSYFLELKSKRGAANDNQKKFRRDIEAAGFEYEIAKSLDAAIEIVKRWGLIRPNFQIPTTGSESKIVAGERSARRARPASRQRTSEAKGGSGEPPATPIRQAETRKPLTEAEAVARIASLGYPVDSVVAAAAPIAAALAGRRGP